MTALDSADALMLALLLGAACALLGFLFGL
jgi:hypothetical protein